MMRSEAGWRSLVLLGFVWSFDAARKREDEAAKEGKGAEVKE